MYASRKGVNSAVMGKVMDKKWKVSYFLFDSYPFFLAV